MAKYTPSTLTGDLAPVNSELEKIQAAINDQMDRIPDPADGVSNNMTDLVDMNSNRITNLAAPVDNNDAVRKFDLDNAVIQAGAIVGNTGS